MTPPPAPAINSNRISKILAGLKDNWILRLLAEAGVVSAVLLSGLTAINNLWSTREVILVNYNEPFISSQPAMIPYQDFEHCNKYIEKWAEDKKLQITATFESGPMVFRYRDAWITATCFSFAREEHSWVQLVSLPQYETQLSQAINSIREVASRENVLKLGVTPPLEGWRPHSQKVYIYKSIYKIDQSQKERLQYSQSYTLSFQQYFADQKFIWSQCNEFTCSFQRPGITATVWIDYDMRSERIPDEVPAQIFVSVDDLGAMGVSPSSDEILDVLNAIPLLSKVIPVATDDDGKK